MRRWYAVHTQARAEEKAEFNLRRQGFEVYLPRLRKMRRHARRTDEVLVPLFPRYLFTALDLTVQPWRSVNGTFGVVHLVGSGDKPTAVPQGLVEAILAQDANGGGIVERPPSFRVQEELEVVDGPFKDLVGRFQQMSDAGRVNLLLEIMGRDVRVSIHHSNLRRVD